MSSERRRILVFRAGHLGDTVIALPAFWAIRNAFPRAWITLLSNSDPYNPHYVLARNVLPEYGLFDDYLSYRNLLAGFRGMLEYGRLAVKLRFLNFDSVFYLMTRGRTPEQIDRDVRFFKLCGISNVLCADHARENLLPAQFLRPAPLIESESDFLLACLASERITVRDNLDFLALSAAERARAADFLEPVLNPNRPVVAVGPGSKWESKIWDEERYARVVDALIQTYNAIPVIFGGPEDEEKGNRLLARWRCGWNAAGALNVREAAAALEKCAFYLGNDTGTMHLAAAVGTRCVAIFAAVDWPGRWYPRGSGHKVFRRSVECEGCHSTVCLTDRRCLNQISENEVLDACVGILKAYRGDS
ncbi:MAG: glycosyltransferase family 9 protein [Pyrinomonadaceae bacterium]